MDNVYLWGRIMKKTKQYFLAGSLIVVAIAAFAGIKIWREFTSAYNGADAWVYIPGKASEKRNSGFIAEFTRKGLWQTSE